MAGVLPQTNATLTEVLAAAPLSDSFVSDSFGSPPENPGSTSKWSGSIGIFVPAPTQSLESSSDGRDELTQQKVYMPCVCVVEIGDELQLQYEGQEHTWKVSGVIKHGIGVEVGASQTYEVAIEVA